LVYYQFSGVVASIALLLNGLLIFGIMIFIRQPLSLPGLAGLVLTVGMSVDANVLIYERIREEIAKGSAARLSIRNGFDRALTTIVDANLTTLIAAAVLYWIGTEQVRGFAVTLIIGIVVSGREAKNGQFEDVRRCWLFEAYLLWSARHRLYVRQDSMYGSFIDFDRCWTGRRSLPWL
jgi:hypothetical protein